MPLNVALGGLVQGDGLSTELIGVVLAGHGLDHLASRADAGFSVSKIRGQGPWLVYRSAERSAVGSTRPPSSARTPKGRTGPSTAPGCSIRSHPSSTDPRKSLNWRAPAEALLSGESGPPGVASTCQIRPPGVASERVRGRRILVEVTEVQNKPAAQPPGLEATMCFCHARGR